MDSCGYIIQLNARHFLAIGTAQIPDQLARTGVVERTKPSKRRGHHLAVGMKLHR